MKFTPTIQKVLRARLGEDENDTRHDAVIAEMSPAMAFRHVVAWELGSPMWDEQIRYWLDACGYDLVEKPPSPH